MVIMAMLGDALLSAISINVTIGAYLYKRLGTICCQSTCNCLLAFLFVLFFIDCVVLNRLLLSL